MLQLGGTGSVIDLHHEHALSASHVDWVLYLDRQLTAGPGVGDGGVGDGGPGGPGVGLGEGLLPFDFGTSY